MGVVIIFTSIGFLTEEQTKKTLGYFPLARWVKSHLRLKPMLNRFDLLRLARLHAAANGISLSTLGRRACGNNRVFTRLAAGGGANIRTLEQVETYLRATWPDNASWPGDIMRNSRSCRATRFSTEAGERE